MLGDWLRRAGGDLTEQNLRERNLKLETIRRKQAL